MNTGSPVSVRLVATSALRAFLIFHLLPRVYSVSVSLDSRFVTGIVGVELSNVGSVG
jgi:hypothetical protein